MRNRSYLLNVIGMFVCEPCTVYSMRRPGHYIIYIIYVVWCTSIVRDSDDHVLSA
jgi:hypothetical protein